MKSLSKYLLGKHHVGDKYAMFESPTWPVTLNSWLQSAFQAAGLHARAMVHRPHLTSPTGLILSGEMLMQRSTWKQIPVKSLRSKSPISQSLRGAFHHRQVLTSALRKTSILALDDVAQWVKHWLACEPKGRQLDSHSGNMPGPQARSPVGGVREAAN